MVLYTLDRRLFHWTHYYFTINTNDVYVALEIVTLDRLRKNWRFCAIDGNIIIIIIIIALALEKYQKCLAA